MLNLSHSCTVYILQSRATRAISERRKQASVDMKSNLSIALLSKNPCEEKSLCKKLDEIDKMKNKILRETTAKMSTFALQHLYIAKYYDAKNGEQCRPPLKVAPNSVCSLPRLTKATEKQQQQPSQACLEPRADCVTSKPRYRRSLSEKSLPLTANLAVEKGGAEDEGKTHCIGSQPSSPRRLVSAQQAKPKYRRSLSEVVAPKGFMVGGEKESGNAPTRFHAWDEKENEGKSQLNQGDAIVLKPKNSRSISQCVAPKLEDLKQEGCKENAGTNVEKGGETPTEALIKRRKQLQRRLTVASETPTISREICRWQQTVKLVKDLPKSEQAEIFRGACFFRMAVPGFNSATSAKPAEKPPRQRKISTVMPPCRQELTPTTHGHFTALNK